MGFLTRRPVAPYHDNEETPLIQFSSSRKDVWRLKDATEGLFICGRTGSGKTSGSGATVAKAFLRAGMGGLVLCAKPDEAERWLRYARETGRQDSVLHFHAESDHRFNFMEYAHATAPAGGLTSNLVKMFTRILETANAESGRKSLADEEFWRNQSRKMLTNVIEALIAADGRLDIGDIMRFINSAATTPQMERNEAWRRQSFAHRTMTKAVTDPGGEIDGHDLDLLCGYWREEFPAMPENTRGSVIATVSAKIDLFQRGALRKIFSTTTTVAPEMTHSGAIILMDFPYREWEDAGQIIQVVMKYLWQRATEKRRAEQTRARHVFLWVDEAHLFLSDYDPEFQSTARSSRACTVYLTQNIPSVLQAFGKDREQSAYALLSNFQTLVMHANADKTTNEYAAHLIGRTVHLMAQQSANDGWSASAGSSDQRQYGESGSYGASSSGASSGSNWSSAWSWSRSRGTSQQSGLSGGSSRSLSQQMDWDVEPAFFTRGLRTGGRDHGLEVDGMVIQNGRRWTRTKKIWTVASFRQ